MICTHCGGNVPGDAAACPRCGTWLAAPSPATGSRGAAATPPSPATASRSTPGEVWGTRVPAPPSGHSGSPGFRLDASRWTRGDRITGIAAVALFISLFLPWYGVDVLGISAEVNGLTGHGYLYIVLISCLAIIGYLGALAGFEELPVRLPLSHRQLLLAASGLNALLVLIAFVTRPGLSGWRFGAFTAIIAAVVAVVPLVRSAGQARRARA